MPRKTNSKEKGDLHIKFNIIFPQNLKAENKDAIIAVLESIEANWKINLKQKKY